jgi:hypothetical protein
MVSFTAHNGPIDLRAIFMRPFMLVEGPNRLAYAFYMKTCLDLGFAHLESSFEIALITLAIPPQAGARSCCHAAAQFGRQGKFHIKLCAHDPEL